MNFCNFDVVEVTGNDGYDNITYHITEHQLFFLACLLSNRTALNRTGARETLVHLSEEYLTCITLLLY